MECCNVVEHIITPSLLQLSTHSEREETPPMIIHIKTLLETCRLFLLVPLTTLLCEVTVMSVIDIFTWESLRSYPGFSLSETNIPQVLAMQPPWHLRPEVPAG